MMFRVVNRNGKCIGWHPLMTTVPRVFKIAIPPEGLSTEIENPLAPLDYFELQNCYDMYVLGHGDEARVEHFLKRYGKHE
jgi:hypothetical protein